MDDKTPAEAAPDAEQLRVTLARLETLTELAFALSGAVTKREVADLVVEQGMRQAGADIASLYVLDESGEALDLLAHRGVAPEVLQKIVRITKTEGNPRVLETLATGVSVWAETEQEYAAIFPEVARLRATGPRAKALWSVPLVVEGRPVGLLGMGFHEEQRFSVADRRFVETFAKLCGQALLRAVRRDRELVAWRWLATTLQSIGDAVIATDTSGSVTFMNGVAERLTGWLDAEARGRPLTEIFQIFSELTREVVESPVTKVLREGRVVGLANHTLLRTRQGVEIPIDDSGAPIRDESGVIYGGGVGVSRRHTREACRKAARFPGPRDGDLGLVARLPHHAPARRGTGRARTRRLVHDRYPGAGCPCFPAAGGGTRRSSEGCLCP